MKIKLLILAIALSLSGCSWIIRFFVVNKTDAPVVLDIRLTKNTNGFPIFFYEQLLCYSGDGKNVDWNTQKEIVPEKLEDADHYRVVLPAHSTLEIGRIHNDKYEKHDQYFINGRVFNLDTLKVIDGNKNTIVTSANFDDLFKKEKGELFYFYK